MGRSHALGFRIAAICVGVGIALLVAEVAVRIVSAQKPPEPKGMSVGPEKGGTFLDRADLTSATHHKSTVRIAFLGDSFTYGLGVEASQTFAYQTGVLLNRRWPAWCATINLGRPGEDLIREWSIYNLVKDGLRPHVVVQVISPNDLDVDFYQDMERIGRITARRSWASRYSLLVAYVEDKVRSMIQYRHLLDYMRGGPTPEARERSWRIISHVIEATRKLVEADGARYVLVRFPFLLDPANPSLDEVHDGTADLARRLGIPYLDLRDAFDKQDKDRMSQHRDDHPSPAAHKIAAEALTDFLVKTVLPKLPRTPVSRPASAPARERIDAAVIHYYEQILELDPTCRSARVSLDWVWQRVGRRQAHPVPVPR
jgi:hypothetical protein